MAKFKITDTFSIKGKGIVLTGKVVEGFLKNSMQADFKSDKIKIKRLEKGMKSTDHANPMEKVSIDLETNQELSKDDFKPGEEITFEQA